MDGNDVGQLWHSPTFSLPAITSLDSIDIDLAHLYGSDVELRLVDTNGGTTVIVEGDDAPNSTNGQDDFTQLGDGGGITAANVRTYTLVDSPTPIFPDASGGALAAGTYGTDGWSTGSFPAGTWTLEIWDTWSGNDGGYVGDVTLNFTAIPEPTSFALAALAMSSILAMRKRTR